MKPEPILKSLSGWSSRDKWGLFWWVVTIGGLAVAMIAAFVR